MRAVNLLGLLLFLAGGGSAANGFGLRSPAPRPISLPLRFEDGVPVILASINGHRAALIVDVGQLAALTLFQSAVDEYKAAAAGRSFSYSDPDGIVTPLPIFEVQSLEFGGVTFRKVDGYVTPGTPPAGSDAAPANGVIGLGALRGFKVVLDYRAKLMTLLPGNGAVLDDYDRCRGVVVPFLPAWNGAPVTMASTDVGDVVFAWETRAPLTVVRRSFAEQASATITHGAVSTQHVTFGAHDFGALRLPTLVYGGSSGTDGFIGNDFMALHVVCFDFPGRRLLIKP